MQAVKCVIFWYGAATVEGQSKMKSNFDDPCSGIYCPWPKNKCLWQVTWACSLETSKIFIGFDQRFDSVSLPRLRVETEDHRIWHLSWINSSQLVLEDISSDNRKWELQTHLNLRYDSYFFQSIKSSAIIRAMSGTKKNQFLLGELEYDKQQYIVIDNSRNHWPSWIV